jgi:hypothetical protein
VTIAAIMSSLPAKYRWTRPALIPDSRTMSCIDVRWNPSRAKQRAAAARIWSRRAARWASLTLGI